MLRISSFVLLLLAALPAPADAAGEGETCVFGVPGRPDDCNDGLTCCPPEQVCTALTCVRRCSTDADCPGQVCDAGRCVRRCATNDDCPRSRLCVQALNGLCVPLDPFSCRRDVDCSEEGPQYVCDGIVCIDPGDRPDDDNADADTVIERDGTCVTANDCPADQYCENAVCVLRCRSNEDCAPGFACDTGSGACTRLPPGTCGKTRDCAAGLRCVDGACVNEFETEADDDEEPEETEPEALVCARDGDCPEPAYCALELVCVLPCAVAAECAGPGQLCDPRLRRCVNPCEPGDCPPGEFCNTTSRLCVPRPDDDPDAGEPDAAGDEVVDPADGDITDNEGPDGEGPDLPDNDVRGRFCEQNNDCLGFGVCLANACEPFCDGPDACGPGRECFERICRDIAPTDDTDPDDAPVITPVEEAENETVERAECPPGTERLGSTCVPAGGGGKKGGCAGAGASPAWAAAAALLLCRRRRRGRAPCG